MAYDSKCFDLAEAFLSDTSITDAAAKDELAQCIQDAIEDWFFVQEQLKEPVRNPGFGTVVQLADALGIPLDRAANTARQPHDWFDYKGLTCCRTCGIVRNDTNATRPCKGPVYVGPRAPSLGRGGPSREIAEPLEKRKRQADLGGEALQVCAGSVRTMRERVSPVGTPETQTRSGIVPR